MVTYSCKVKSDLACSGRNSHNEIFVLFTKKTWAYGIFCRQVIYLLTLSTAKIVLVKGDPVFNSGRLQCHTNNMGIISRNLGQEQKLCSFI